MFITKMMYFRKTIDTFCTLTCQIVGQGSGSFSENFNTNSHHYNSSLKKNFNKATNPPPLIEATPIVVNKLFLSVTESRLKIRISLIVTGVHNIIDRLEIIFSC